MKEDIHPCDFCEMNGRCRKACYMVIEYHNLKRKKEREAEFAKIRRKEKYK